MGDNGTGEGGGNSSVWWQIRHGSAKYPQELTVADLAPAAGAMTPALGVITRPERGQVRVTNADPQALIEVHDSTNLSTLGSPDHSGMFRVRLRIKAAVMQQLIDNEQDPERKAQLQRYWAALPGVANSLAPFTGQVSAPANEMWEDTRNDVFLVIDVPAIERKPKGGPWPHLPWEIHWQW